MQEGTGSILWPEGGSSLRMRELEGQMIVGIGSWLGVWYVQGPGWLLGVDCEVTACAFRDSDRAYAHVAVSPLSMCISAKHRVHSFLAASVAHHRISLVAPAQWYAVKLSLSNLPPPPL